jgi:hypothetical protein
MNQTGFAAHLVEDNNAHTRNITPDATPYRSGLPIDVIPKSDKDNNCQPSSNTNVATKVSSAQSAGLPKPPTQTSPQRTRSSQPTTTSRRKATGMQPSTPSTTSTRQLTTASCLHPPSMVPSILICHSLRPWIQKHIRMPSPLPKTSTITSPCTVTRAGDHNLVTRSRKASSFPSSNLEA